MSKHKNKKKKASFEIHPIIIVEPKPVYCRFSGNITFVGWEDGEMTTVECSNKDEFDFEKGIAMAIAKRFIPRFSEFLEFAKDADFTDKTPAVKQIDF
jgi:hypothetical protein